MWSGSPDPLTCGVDLLIRSRDFEILIICNTKQL